MMNADTALTRRDFLARSAALAAGGVAACAAAPVARAAEKTPPKDRWQIGIYTRPWDQQDWRVALDAMAEAGYRYAGLMTTKAPQRLVISATTTPDEANVVGEQCRKRGLNVASVYGGDIPVKESLEAGIAGLRRLIDNCVAVGAADLMMGGTGNPALQDAYYKAIAECCPYAAGKGLGISVKPHGGLNSTGPQCRKIIEGVGRANFSLWYDPGNIFYYSDGALDPVTDAATVDGLVCGMSVKDFQPPKEVLLTPGTGRVDFAAVLARLKAGGFTGGPLIVETLARGDLAQTLAEAKKARAFVEELVAKVG
jgi:sugar phosphate isomerase/epimerase